MESDFEFVQIPGHLLGIIGQADEGTRTYRQYGTDREYAAWWDAVCEICGNDAAVSPGGVAMYARVSRAGVYKRMKEGRITAFCFHLVKAKSRLTGREILAHGGQPYVYIPGKEARAWAEVLGRMEPEQADQEAAGDGDSEGTFLRAKGRTAKRGKGK